MSGSMRGASYSRLNVESGEGKVKELVDKFASICSIEDCMMLARAFNSARASSDTLKRTVKHLISTMHARHTLRDGSERGMLLTEKTKKLTEVALERFDDIGETAKVAQMKEDALEVAAIAGGATGNRARLDVMGHVNDEVADCISD